jgi:hypothetical protein
VLDSLRVYRESVAIRPEVTIRTTTGDDGAHAASVVSGYGADPASAVRSLTRCARTEARAYLGDHPGPPCVFDVVGVTLVAGKVPDDRPEAERHAVRDGWAAIGTMIVVPAGAAGRRAAG